jgi:nucleotide-binding universal stress UspA family protein
MLHAFSPVPEVIEKVLVPLDGSSLGEQALTMVKTLAGRPVQQVRLLRAIEHDDQMEAATQHLEGVGEGLAEQGLGVDLDVRVEEPAEAIFHAASHTDLVILCTHGRGGWDRWRHGSVAERAVHGLQTPFLLVRAERAPAADATTG